MKEKAITKIVLYSVAIILLLGILLPGIGIGSLRLDLKSSDREYCIGPGSVDAKLVKDLNIEWFAGNIEIVTANTNSISFSENNSDGDPLAYYLEGGTLTIRYRKPSVSIGFFTEVPKTLTVTVPRFWNCNHLSLEINSADICVDSLIAEDVALHSASGEGKFVSCSIASLEINTVSGQIDYTGRLKMLDFDTASADFVGVFKNVPNKINVDSASGNLDIINKNGKIYFHRF